MGGWRYVVNALVAVRIWVLVMGRRLHTGGEIVMRLGALCGLEGRWRHVVDAFLFVFERLREVVVPLLEGGVGPAGRHRVDLQTKTIIRFTSGAMQYNQCVYVGYLFMVSFTFRCPAHMDTKGFFY